MEESIFSFSLKIKGTTTFSFSKLNQTIEGKNYENGFVGFKKEDEFALFNEPLLNNS